jgi:ferritin-like metal-binding protein YciE
MAQDKMQKKLVELMGDAHSMEEATLKMLDSMISQTKDNQTRTALERHKRETEQHEQRLEKRLQAMGAKPSKMKEAAGVIGAMAKGMMDKARSDKPFMIARDGYATEHMEIAAYEMMERIAQRAGDMETAEVARRNRQEEEQMAQRIAENWDKFVELDLVEEGVLAR